MAFKIVAIFAILAVASAGYIDAPGHSAYTGGDYHGYEVAPIAKVATYAAAPSVSHVYTSAEHSHYDAPVNHHKTIGYAAPVHAVQYAAAPVHHKTVQYATPVHKTVEYATPVHKTIEYATPVHKTVQYATPVQKTVEYAAPVKSTYYTAAAPAHNTHYSTEKHIHSVPTHTLAYPVAAPKAVAYSPVYETHSAPTYGHTHESVERSHDGTVSHYGKTISTPHSHVQKYDTRVTNEHYKVAAVPVVHQYNHEAPAVHHYSHSAPTVHQYSHAAPAVHHYAQAAPAVHQYTHEAPAVHHYSHAAPAVHQYAHNAPVVAHKTVNYSPAEAVAHTHFESADAHYSW